MTNREIIMTELAMLGIDFPYDGTNLLTYEEWKKRGYYVRAGEKALIKPFLWKKITKTVKDKDGNETQVERFISVKTALFAPFQVEKMAQKVKAI